MAEAQFGPFSGAAVVRSTHMEDRYVDTADGALAQAGFAVRLRQTGRGTIVSVKSLARRDGPGGAVRREELEGPADRTAGAARLAGLGRALARPRAGRRRAARRARHDPPDPAQADRPRRRHARRAQPRRGRCRRRARGSSTASSSSRRSWSRATRSALAELAERLRRGSALVADERQQARGGAGGSARDRATTETVERPRRRGGQRAARTGPARRRQVSTWSATDAAEVRATRGPERAPRPPRTGRRCRTLSGRR